MDDNYVRIKDGVLNVQNDVNNGLQDQNENLNSFSKEIMNQNRGLLEKNQYIQTLYENMYQTNKKTEANVKFQQKCAVKSDKETKILKSKLDVLFDFIKQTRVQDMKASKAVEDRKKQSKLEMRQSERSKTAFLTVKQEKSQELSIGEETIKLKEIDFINNLSEMDDAEYGKSTIKSELSELNQDGNIDATPRKSVGGGYIHDIVYDEPDVDANKKSTATPKETLGKSPTDIYLKKKPTPLKKMDTLKLSEDNNEQHKDMNFETIKPKLFIKTMENLESPEKKELHQRPSQKMITLHVRKPSHVSMEEKSQNVHTPRSARSNNFMSHEDHAGALYDIHPPKLKPGSKYDVDSYQEQAPQNVSKEQEQMQESKQLNGFDIDKYPKTGTEQQLEDYQDKLVTMTTEEKEKYRKEIFEKKKAELKAQLEEKKRKRRAEKERAKELKRRKNSSGVFPPDLGSDIALEEDQNMIGTKGQKTINSEDPLILQKFTDEGGAFYKDDNEEEKY